MKNKTNSFKKKKLLIGLLILMLTGVFLVICINAYVISSSKSKIVTADEAASLKADCILVLGAGVWNNGKPSAMLEDSFCRV